MALVVRYTVHLYTLDKINFILLTKIFFVFSLLQGKKRREEKRREEKKRRQLDIIIHKLALCKRQAVHRSSHVYTIWHLWHHSPVCVINCDPWILKTIHDQRIIHGNIRIRKLMSKPAIMRSALIPDDIKNGLL
jgi:hypothetical protein